MNPGRHLGRQALVESLEVAPESCAARHEHGLAVPAVQGAVPGRGQTASTPHPPSATADLYSRGLQDKLPHEAEVHIKLLQGSWRLSKL